MLLKKKKHTESDNTDRWLLTYSDLITLLLGLFVILYGMSKIDTEKYGQVVAALGGVFGRETAGVLNGNDHVMPGGVSPLQAERNRILSTLEKALGGTQKQGLVTFSQNERGVTVHLMEALLFNSGSADLKSSSYKILDTLGSIIKRLPNDIRIEGHTDDVPIHTDRFPSNWHLSVNRAVNTGYYMLNQYGLNAEKVSVVGYAEYRPLVPNTSEENRARNRRVDIIIVTNVVNRPVTTTGTDEIPSQRNNHEME
ncbi:MAG TPA: flagellar motor protein MotB [Bacteroidota bacterium]|nr:flagellar motor protein MotB [Bacteroidota bacterium]